ncbi:MAG: hydantoinase/oxoprolinase family protein, partial [Pseudomonadota bacterium]
EFEGEQHSIKVLTTYDAPERAILDGIRQVCRAANRDPCQIEQIVHGTTLATNALIERSGAKTALITTQGFRDVIEMRTESRFEQYDLNLLLPEPLIPRQCRYTLPERIAANGDVLLPLEDADVIELAEKLKHAQYDSVAIGFLHSYANTHHEERVRELLSSTLPDVQISLSCEVSPQMREYERFNTTVANAYIKPLMKTYLGRLGQRLEDIGITCPLFLMHSGGGIISIESAAEFPVRLVESGPAGGAVFAAHIAQRYGLEKVLSFDMGGTTAKICLIKEQSPKTSRVFEVARSYRFKKGSGMPISIPVIDMVEIGAGGGSLARVDALRQIRVGPESAGSEPGPACYARDGSKPAVTDADLLLGKLDPLNFAGGSLTLDKDKAASAIDDYVAHSLEMDTVTAAYGIVEVVDENMANAARVHAVENGEDLNEYTMIAFGGAAPLHAARLCQKLAINRLLIPVGAGVGSAIGFLRAPFSFEANKSTYMSLDDFDATMVKDIFHALQVEAEQFVRSCAPSADITSVYKAYMRYAGQGWEIPVSLSAEQASSPSPQEFKSLFETQYEALFGRTVVGMVVEVTVWSVLASTPKQAVNPVGDSQVCELEGNRESRPLFDPAVADYVDANMVTRSEVAPGMGVTGPALIVEDETTIVMPTDSSAICQQDGCIDIRVNTGEARG